MVNIKIRPASGGVDGRLCAEGHAGAGPKGSDLVCASITALLDGLYANLDYMWSVNAKREARDGHLVLRWRGKKRGKIPQRSNDAAGFTYRALRALEEAYPVNLHVTWERGADHDHRTGD